MGLVDLQELDLCGFFVVKGCFGAGMTEKKKRAIDLEKMGFRTQLPPTRPMSISSGDSTQFQERRVGPHHHHWFLHQQSISTTPGCSLGSQNFIVQNLQVASVRFFPKLKVFIDPAQKGDQRLLTSCQPPCTHGKQMPHFFFWHLLSWNLGQVLPYMLTELDREV